MCWSAEVSWAMVAAGSAATAYTLHRRDAPAIPATFAYFSVMEALQAVGYGSIGNCGSPANQTVTLLSYLHIAFQPFFVNAFALALLGAAVATRVRVGVWIACGVSAVVMVLQIYPFAWAGRCTAGTTLCGETLCLVHGTWHIAWDVPYTALVPHIPIVPGVGISFPTYLATAFLLPVAYGAWRFALYHALVGPVLASLLTSNPNEMPAIWCLFSIGLVFVALVPWLRRRIGGTPWPFVAARAAPA
jgi:hypothetical protein